ncbi:hypothetical protein CPC08DRAFT_147556 [Agrocybe pediades]|nr:hypothetical protein CPC08DRAFT_147556 [Agrocybe pediades]
MRSPKLWLTQPNRGRQHPTPSLDLGRFLHLPFTQPPLHLRPFLSLPPFLLLLLLLLLIHTSSSSPGEDARRSHHVRPLTFHTSQRIPCHELRRSVILRVERLRVVCYAWIVRVGGWFLIDLK